MGILYYNLISEIKLILSITKDIEVIILSLLLNYNLKKMSYESLTYCIIFSIDNIYKRDAPLLK